MKKNLFLIISLLIVTISFSQGLLQASLGPAIQQNRVKIYLKSNITLAQVNISTLQFNLAVDASIVQRPKCTVVSTTFPGVTWQINEAVEGGFIHFMITTATTPIAISNIVANTEFEVLEVRFTEGPIVPNNVFLVSLPDGGSGPTNGNALFLATSAGLLSNGSNLYFARSGTTVNNQFSYDVTGATSGIAVSTAVVGNIILPITWLNFSAVRQVNDALISWTIDNDAENEKYAVERSIDGTNFTSITEISKRLGSGPKQYSFLDKSITSLGTKIIYYRVKNLEINNKVSYTDIKTVRLDVKGETSLFPNPARDGFTLSIPYLNPNQEKIQLLLVNSLGQIIERKEITRQAASNYYYNLQVSLITSGDYLLRIFEDGQLSETKKILIKK